MAKKGSGSLMGALLLLAPFVWVCSLCDGDDSKGSLVIHSHESPSERLTSSRICPWPSPDAAKQKR